MPHSSDPHRECDTFDISRSQLAAALAQLLPAASGAAAAASASTGDSQGAAARAAAGAAAGAQAGSGPSEALLAALVDAGLARVAHVPPSAASWPSPNTAGGAAAAPAADPSSPPRLEVLVRAPSAEEVEEGSGSHVRQRWVVLSWLAEALQGAAEAAEATEAAQVEAAQVEAAHVEAAQVEAVEAAGAGRALAAGLRRLSDEPEEVLAALLEVRRRELLQLEAAARVGPGASGPGGELRRGVVGVAEVARRAVDRALAQERARIAR